MTAHLNIRSDPAQPVPSGRAAQYVFICDVVDIACRVRTLKSTRVIDASLISVACRLVWTGAATLFRPGYQGFPKPADDQLLRAALQADASQYPDDYDRLSRVKRTHRGVWPRPDDHELVRDFVCPLVDGDAEENLITVPRRSMRLRERASLEELDVISGLYLAQRAINPDMRFEVGNTPRWLVVI